MVSAIQTERQSAEALTLNWSRGKPGIDRTTSHSTRLSRNNSLVAGYLRMQAMVCERREVEVRMSVIGTRQIFRGSLYFGLACAGRKALHCSGSDSRYAPAIDRKSTRLNSSH